MIRRLNPVVPVTALVLTCAILVVTTGVYVPVVTYLSRILGILTAPLL
jgi:hypothetical protein